MACKYMRVELVRFSTDNVIAQGICMYIYILSEFVLYGFTNENARAPFIINETARNN